MFQKIAATMLAIFISLFSVASPAWAQAGNWTIFFDWGCDGTYASAGLTLASDGTYTDSQGGSGVWFDEAGTLVLRYNEPPNTVYSGYLVGKSATGVQSTFSGGPGCFYMLSSSLSQFRSFTTDGPGPAGN